MAFENFEFPNPELLDLGRALFSDNSSHYWGTTPGKATICCISSPASKVHRKKSTIFGRSVGEPATPPSTPAAQWLGRPRWDNEVERVLWPVAATRRRRSFWNSTRCILLSHLDSRSAAGFKRCARGPTHTGTIRAAEANASISRGPLNDIFFPGLVDSWV